jgi:hypothetical protein
MWAALIYCFDKIKSAVKMKKEYVYNVYFKARNQDNVSEWCDMSTRGLLFLLASTMKIQLSVLS